MPTKIAWTDESWNPVTGCTPVSEGCAHCYAKKMSKRFGGDFSKVTLHPDRLDIPLHWRKPRMVFVPSMGDLFHEDVPDEFIAQVFGAISLAPRHTFQVLTKRPERMVRLLDDLLFRERAYIESDRISILHGGPIGWPGCWPGWPLPNVWLGVSVENQARADERIPLLLDTPATVRFVSAEPLLGPLDFHGSRWLFNRDHLAATFGNPSIDWVIVGGESGGPENRRLVEKCDGQGIPSMKGDSHVHWKRELGLKSLREQCTGYRPKPEALEWVHSIRDQCQAAGVAFWFKQWGPRAGQGTRLDGREHRERPEVRA